MKFVWSDRSWDEYVYWQTHDSVTVIKINELIKDTKRSPFRGIGKPEPLKNDLKGWWARRISKEHRFVYRVEGSGENQSLEIAACRFHY